MRVKKTRIRNSILAAITLIVLCLRPAFPGQVLNEAILLGPLCGMALVYLLLGFPVRLSLVDLTALLILGTFCAYVLYHTAVFTPFVFRDVAQFVVVMVLVACLAAFLFRAQDSLLVLKVISYPFIILGFSQIVTYSIAFLLQDPGLLRIGDVVAPNLAQPWPITLYFPFTLTAGSEWFLGTLYPRATGIFREPGIYQAFVIFTFFAIDYLEIRGKNLVRTVMAFSLLTVFSTAGFVIFLTTLFYHQRDRLRRRRTFLLAIVLSGIILIAAIIVWNLDVLGVRYKLYTQGVRLEQVQTTIDILQENFLFGVGIGNGVGINFVAVLSALGVVGGFLYLLFVSYSALARTSARSFVLYLPFVLTLLLAQPLYNKGVVIFMLFLSLKLPLHQTARAGDAPPFPPAL